MATIINKAFRPMLRPMSMRNVHLPGTPGIYNTKPNWKPGPNWKPQSPTGPFIDGWAYAVGSGCFLFKLIYIL